MFGENDYLGINHEMSIEETVGYLRQKQICPEGISDADWEFIKTGALDDEDQLEGMKDILLSSMDNSEGVLTLGWDGEGPGHSGIKTIEKWAGCYLFGSSDHDDHGPFRKIEEALDLEYFWQEGVPGGDLWFDPNDVPMKKVMKIAHAMCGEEDGTVRINDVEYVRKGDAVVQV